LAVGHNQFKAYTEGDFERLSVDKQVVMDIKNIVDKPTWRL